MNILSYSHPFSRVACAAIRTATTRRKRARLNGFFYQGIVLLHFILLGIDPAFAAEPTKLPDYYANPRAAQASLSDETPVALKQPPVVPPDLNTADSKVRTAFEASFEQERLLKYAAAIETLKALGDQPQQRFIINLRLGWLHYLNAEHAKSREYYQAAIEDAPAATEPRVGMLLPLLAEKKYTEAIVVARKTLLLEPSNYFANLRFSYALRMTGQLDEAEIINSRMLVIRPTDTTFLAEQASIHLARKEESAARALFEKILLLEPSNKLAREQLGLAPLPSPAATPSLPLAPSAKDVFASEPKLTFGIMPSLASLNYGSASIKKDGLGVGVYGYISQTNLLEFSVDYTHLNYRDGTNLDQEDYTLIYSHLAKENWKLRLGGHGIGSTDDFGNGSWYTLAGLSYYQPEAWDVGVDVFHSHYENSAFSLDVNQITPHIAVEHRFLKGPKMRLETLGYYIDAGSNIGLETTNFYSAETRWRLDGEKWGVGVYAYTGKQAYAIRRDGFLVYNLNEEHTGGYGGEFTYRIAEQTWLTMRATEELFADIITGNGTHQFVIAGLLSRSF